MLADSAALVNRGQPSGETIATISRGKREGLSSVRMEDVARSAGVSAITVSRAVNVPHKLAPATLRAVRAAIAKLGYVPNLTAGSLASNRSRTIGVIVPTVANSIFADTIDGLSQTLGPERYHLLLGQSHYREEQEAALVDAFVGRRVDGLVLTGVTHARGVRARLQRAALPVVETWDTSARPIDMLVGFSNVDAGRAAASFLIGKGWRRLAYIGGSDERSSKRLAGFRAGARACGVADVAVVQLPSSSQPSDGATATAGLLAGPVPQALFCSNDTLAAGALFECARRGVRVPADMAVMGFADLPIATAIEPKLTTVQVRAREMGERAGVLLLQRLAGNAPAERVVDLGFAVAERAST
ncbi:MAG: LacI family DNA-binding transcriptional regulator [Burkholderiaceae bacterium]|nr:LacI family DNA-binding transcriptional regulator [Burkholderiaceae bacterium]